MKRFTAADFQGYSVPYAGHAGADTPGRYVTAAQRQFLQHDAGAAWGTRRSAADFQGRPTPYALDEHDADASDRYVSTTQRHFGAVHAERRQAWGGLFQSRQVPYATDGSFAVGTDDGGVGSAGQYVTATERFYRARPDRVIPPPERARAPAGRGKPFAEHAVPGAWSTTHRGAFVKKDLLEARPVRRWQQDSDYNP